MHCEGHIRIRVHKREAQSARVAGLHAQLANVVVRAAARKANPPSGSARPHARARTGAWARVLASWREISTVCVARPRRDNEIGNAGCVALANAITAGLPSFKRLGPFEGRPSLRGNPASRQAKEAVRDALWARSDSGEQEEYDMGGD